MGRPERNEGSRSYGHGILRRFAPQNDLLVWWGLLGLAIIWGMVVGLLKHNNFGDLFLDANGYFYAAMVLPFIWVFYSRHSERNASGVKNPVYKSTGSFTSVQDDIVWRIFFAATTLLALKTLFTVYLFTHSNNNFIAANLTSFYRWIRDTGVGEITWLSGNFTRVFFQSHIYNVAAFFLLLVGIITPPTSPYLKGRRILVWMLLVLNISIIIISLSRSFWVGTLTGLTVLVVAVAFRRPWRLESRRYITRMASILIAVSLFAIILIFAITRFPFPRPSAISLAETLEERTAIGTEAAAASRWNLLPPLMDTILRHPIAGSGFGATVTYISNDPRIREQNPTGQYTTYAFEWGWLDLWLKLGTIGLALYAMFLFKLIYALYKRARFEPHSLAAFATVISLAAVHIFTPYLNHPLGFGILILATIILLAPKNDIFYAIKSTNG
ncbi:MAG: hypothetical protein UX17_C0064G0002 [Parcubacteria group bacterium GW2011_GWC2_45_7]|nr:MAG: hypothetical protein UX17_C0064G0002 [Parcubacteria group bacterium GW2011_GWC2_45_7]